MNILLLDDDPTNVALLAHLLDGVPNVVLTEFTDPMLALEWCRTEQPDLLLGQKMVIMAQGDNLFIPFLQNHEILRPLKRAPSTSHPGPPGDFLCLRDDYLLSSLFVISGAFPRFPF